jgi:hypothetical protein
MGITPEPTLATLHHARVTGNYKMAGILDSTLAVFVRPKAGRQGVHSGSRRKMSSVSGWSRRRQ